MVFQRLIVKLDWSELAAQVLLHREVQGLLNTLQNQMTLFIFHLNESLLTYTHIISSILKAARSL